jgi:hypothetical protein
MSLAPIEEAFDRAQTIRVLRLIMLAVENSKKGRLARSPWARIIAGSLSSPARTSAGSGMIFLVCGHGSVWDGWCTHTLSFP